MPKADTETPTVYKYAEWLSSGSAFFNHPAQRPFDRRKICIERRATGVEHDVPLRSKLGVVQSKCRTKPAFDTIAKHRFADRARDGKPEASAAEARSPRLRFAPPFTKSGEQRTGDAKAVVIDGAEFGGPQDPGRFRKSLFGAGRGFSWRFGRLSHR